MPPKGSYGDPDKVNGSFFEDLPDDDVMNLTEAVANERAHIGGLTVGKVRTSTTANDFLTWFGARLGHRLWGLLHGIDDTEVIPTPPFPKQLSVEDSYPDNSTTSSMFHNLGILTKSLVRRLDLDLRIGDVYVRFPRTLRLSMRNGRQLARESKSARMPVDLFDLAIPTERRVESVGRTVNALAKAIVAGWPAGWKIGVINIAATDLTEEIPGRGIQGFIERSKKEDQIDWEFIRELPEDIRTEVLRQHHLPSKQLEGSRVGEEKFMVYVNNEVQDDTDDEWDDGDYGEMEDTKETCGICGVRIFSWMTDAHARYHESSVA